VRTWIRPNATQKYYASVPQPRSTNLSTLVDFTQAAVPSLVFFISSNPSLHTTSFNDPNNKVIHGKNSFNYSTLFHMNMGILNKVNKVNI